MTGVPKPNPVTTLVDDPPSVTKTTTLLNAPSLEGLNRMVRLVAASAGTVNATLATDS